MKSNQKALLGIICLSTGATLILAMLLPGWLWTLFTASILIGCGIMLFSR